MVSCCYWLQQLQEVLNGKALCFDGKSCRYNVDKCRESTGRVVVWREFETIRSYTMESSFCGMDKGTFAVGSLDYISWPDK